MIFSDSHFHLTDDRICDRFLFLQQAVQKNIHYFLEAGVDSNSWQKQIVCFSEIELYKQKLFNLKYYNALGLHPYKVAELTYDECEIQLNELSNLLHHQSVVAIGETGLDFREQYIESEGLQIDIFEKHIEIAKIAQKPLVLHIVKAHQEAIKVLQFSDVNKKYLTKNKINGQVHAFNSSFEIAQEYIKLGFLISIGGAVTFEKNKKLREAVRQIPLESLLLESDSPDQPPANWNSEFNDSCSLLQVAQEIANIKEISVDLVIEQTTKKFINFIGIG